MAKEVVVNVKITAAQAKKNIEELNKSLSASEDLIKDLEQELTELNKEMDNSAGKSDKAINSRIKLNKQIEQTKNKIEKEKNSIKTINKERRQQNKIIQNSTKQTADYSGVIGILDRQTGGLISGVTGLTGSIGKATQGFKLLRVAIIGTGIGALVIAITSVATAFTNSESGQNKFRKLMTQIGVVVGNVTDILGDLGNVIINVFTGNFKEAGKALSDVTDGIKNFGEETRKEIAIAGELADRRAEADLLERKLITERAEATRKFNELREKAADKENVSIADRIAALKEAGRIEEEITLKEIEAARIRFETKKAENELSESSKADLDEQARLEARLIELEAQRLKRQKTLTAEITTNLREAESERKRIQAEADAEQKRIDDEKAAKDKEATDAKLAAEKQLAELKKQIRDAEAVSEDEKRALEIEKVTAHYDNLIALAKKNGLDITKLEEAKNNKITSLNKESNDEEIKDDKMTTEKKVELTLVGLGGIAQLVGQSSGFGKAVAVAQAIQDTYAGANKAIAQGGIFGGIAAAGIIAAGLANVKKITSTKTPQPPALLGAGTGGGVATPTPQAPSFNIVGSDPQTQLADAIGQQTQKPVKAFVVAGDVSTAQSLDRNIIQESSLG
tara:strand:+ start:1758 stop:3629 length:1872 start_codon:yes stop_codon:yes gene_type:complete